MVMVMAMLTEVLAAGPHKAMSVFSTDCGSTADELLEGSTIIIITVVVLLVSVVAIGVSLLLMRHAKRRRKPR
jgi:hypothetical protein